MLMLVFQSVSLSCGIAGIMNVSVGVCGLCTSRFAGGSLACMFAGVLETSPTSHEVSHGACGLSCVWEQRKKSPPWSSSFGCSCFTATSSEVRGFFIGGSSSAVGGSCFTATSSGVRLGGTLVIHPMGTIVSLSLTSLDALVLPSESYSSP